MLVAVRKHYQTQMKCCISNATVSPLNQEKLTNAHKPSLSHVDILLVISIDDMHITHLNKYIKTLLNRHRSHRFLSLSIFKMKYIRIYTSL